MGLLTGKTAIVTGAARGLLQKEQTLPLRIWLLMKTARIQKRKLRLMA